MIDRDIERELTPTLTTGEVILWAARPKPGIAFQRSDIIMIPFSLIWGGFAIFWTFMVVSMGAPFFFGLFGIPFVLIGLYMMVGRFFADARRRAGTRYALTRDRIIIRSGVRTTTVNSIQISALGDMTMEQKADGSGTIILIPDTNSPGATNYSSLTNFGRGPTRYVKQGPRLEMIDNVQGVYNQILELQRGR